MRNVTTEIKTYQIKWLCTKIPVIEQIRAAVPVWHQHQQPCHAKNCL